MHQVDLVDVERFARAEDGDDDGEADGGFRGGDDHDEEDEDLSGDRVPAMRERDEVRLTALSISSIDMKTEMTLRLMRKAAMPMEKRMAARMR